jgi:ABC-type multidrug transport system fused ATPase/permease subunit
MLVGEIAFSQGCRFLVNTCFGLDEVGADLVQQGLTARGSWQFMAWLAFKLVVLPLIFFMLIGGAQVIMNTWVLPSANKRERALEVIQEAAAIRQKMAREKTANLAEIRTIKADLAQREAKLAARRQRLWRYVRFKKTEVKELKELITQLEQQVEVLEIAKAAAQAFSGRKR